MSIFDPTPAEKAALQERLRQLHDSAVNGVSVTPMQALEERIARGDTDARALKANILAFRSTARRTCEKEPKITRAITLETVKVSFRGATLQMAKVRFSAKR